ncbi:Hpt domain-containing protein [uncultured Oscillibacter sp.]|uniref:Hpt domain-containing protein n=1 Tax=uncultured Oscillibacter sp. TaxID=876091 RepID=UPI0025E98E34|nr:Hpt domain-containing protein [uncultured Oscillibacter sp.]
MSKLTDQLRAHGADMDGAMNRLLGDEALYAMCFDLFLEDPAFATLGAALDAGDRAAAFEAAHSLKGVAGNLGLTRIYRLSGELVEPLRGCAAAETDLPGLYADLMEERAVLRLLTEK